MAHPPSITLLSRLKRPFPPTTPSHPLDAILTSSIRRGCGTFTSASSLPSGSRPCRSRPRRRRWHDVAATFTFRHDLIVCPRSSTSSPSISSSIVVLRRYGTTAPSDAQPPPPSPPSPPSLRIAIVGGGAAGMSTALHLAPLVSAGLLPPVDLYEARDKCRSAISSSDGGRQTEPGSGAVGRDIGVGIWSTAWEPFLRSLSENEEGEDGDGDDDEATAATTLRRHKRRRASHVRLLRDLEACGSYVKDVGYRTPDGTWLVRSVLNDRPFGIRDVLDNGSGSDSGGDDISNDDDSGSNSISNSNKISNSISNEEPRPRPRHLGDNRLDPALLFVREKDLLSCLRNAIRAEQSLGTIRYHAGTKVRELDLDLADDPLDRHAGRLILLPSDDPNASAADATVSPPYHLVVAADGLRSSLRARYAGHHSHNASTTGMDSTRDHREDGGAMESIEYRWEHTQGQREATQVDDRKYVVFRGNAPKLDDADDGDDGSQSFQTWGEERSMRFAAVPFRHACDADEDDDAERERERGPSFRWKRKDDEEVWFATLSDPLLYDGGIDAMTAEQRKQFLLAAFGSWHEPVKTLVASTPAEKIMYETAVAHRYCASPVVDVARIWEFERWRKRQERRDGDGDGNDNDNRDGDDEGEEPTIRGPGPILVFVGDSCMTVDPVLAQGFTIAMEAGASLASSVETVVAASAAITPSSSEIINPLGNSHNLHHSPPSIQQQTHKLKQELLRRHALRERRLIQLLRSTELVQIMAQPHGVVGGFVARWVVRPLMRYCPEVVKRGVFHWVIRYSLGLTGGYDGGGAGAGAGGSGR